jgi:N-acetylglucosaminyl-diphospho-decaprenol L-rhamnosyltransferase
MTKVVVCIVGFRNPFDIEACLASLAASTHHAFEVVICENGGKAARDALDQRLPRHLAGGQSVSVLPYAGNTGYAGGNNRCIDARPDAQIWWMLNPDARVAYDAMAQLVHRLESGNADAVGGTLLKSDGKVQAYGGRWVPLLGRAISLGYGTSFDAATHISTKDVDYIVGASLMFTKRFIRVAGPMREDYFLYGEEVEWCLRAKARGLTLGIEQAAIIHHAQGTTTGDGGKFGNKPKLPVYLDQRNKLLILRDTTPAMFVPGAIGSLLALTIRAAKHGAWRQFRYGLAGWAAGLCNERGVPRWLPVD